MAAWFWLCFLLGLLHVVMDEKPRERNFWIVIDKIISKRVAEEYFEDQNCVLTQYRNRSFVDCNFILQRNVSRVQLDAQLDMMRPNNQKIRLLNVHLELCDLLTTVDKNPLVNLIAKSFIKIIDKNLRCPLKSYFNYSFTNFHLKETDFPYNVPECQTKSLLKFYTENKLVFITTLWGKVVRKK